jgi:hypothetical protein
VVDLPFPLAVDYTCNAFWRDAYNKASPNRRARSSTGEMLSTAEARQLVEVQRNGLVLEHIEAGPGVPYPLLPAASHEIRL